VITAISMWKNEADIGPTIIRHLLAEGIDLIIVADNGSTDGTRDHLADFAKHAPVEVVDDPEPAYFQSAKMTRLAHMAGQRGATYIVAFDADELWYSPHGRLGDVLRNAVHPVQWVEGMYHIPHDDDDPDESDPIRRMVHRRAGRDCPQSKVCFRYLPTIRIAQGNHRVEHPGAYGQGLVAFREFQYRSYEHFVHKVRQGKAAYDAGGEGLHPELGIHWRRLGALSDAELEVEWKDYLATPTVYDPAPLRTTELARS
jgi:glycosyltransferase involved in cell wall biosynthesis